VLGGRTGSTSGLAVEDVLVRRPELLAVVDGSEALVDVRVRGGIASKSSDVT
jgi:hypothetical protein